MTVDFGAIARGSLELGLRALTEQIANISPSLRQMAVTPTFGVGNWRSLRDAATQKLNAGDAIFRQLQNLPDGVRAEVAAPWDLAVDGLEGAMIFTVQKSIYEQLRTEARAWLSQRGVEAPSGPPEPPRAPYTPPTNTPPPTQPPYTPPPPSSLPPQGDPVDDEPGTGAPAPTMSPVAALAGLGLLLAFAVPAKR